MIPVASNRFGRLTVIALLRAGHLIKRQGVRYFHQNVLQRAKEPRLVPLQLPFLRQMDGFLHYLPQKQMILDRSNTRLAKFGFRLNKQLTIVRQYDMLGDFENRRCWIADL